MHTHSSTHLALRARPTLSPTSTALAAFAVLVFRLARRDEIAFEVRSDVAQRSVRLQIATNSRLAEVIDALPTIAAMRTLTLDWRDEDMRIALVVRLPSMEIDREASSTAGVVATMDPVGDLAAMFSHVASSASARRTRVSDVPLVSSEERARLLDVASRSAPAPELLDDGVLHALFEDQARARPDAIAVEDGATTIRYGELAARAADLARELRGRGVGRGSRIALKIPRGIDAYVAMLGVLGAGAAYVPIDVETPDERARFIVDDARASILLHSGSLGDAQTLRRPDGIAQAPSADDLAYVLYTSGSTGRPKGVAVTHRNVRHLVRAERRLFGVRADDRVLQGFSLGFDAAVEEIWLAFASGATLVVAAREVLLGDLARSISEREITVFSTVPSLLATLDDALPGVRVLIVGGEACPREIARRFARSDRPLFNTYGPTEATVIATAKRMIDDAPPTIGRPLPNTWAYVLDENGNPMPAGVAGELCLGGVGVARGYVGAATSSTASRFVPNPAGDRVGAPPIVYRTGDRVRLDANGELEFLGRVDDQVKVRGFRVELAEIESALLRCDEVLEAAAAVVDDRLVAWIVLRAPAADDDLRHRLAQTLPSYMIPSRFERVHALPRLPSGKIDRRSLRLPEKQGDFLPRAIAAADEKDDDEIEALVREAWREIFCDDDIARDAHFFHDLGGHSLLAAKSLALLRRHPRLTTLSIADVYAHPTIAELAAHVRAITPPVAARPVSDAIDARAHFVTGAAQALASLVVFTLHAAQWLGPYVTFVLTRSVIDALAVLLLTPPSMLLLAVASKWLVLGRVRAGSHARSTTTFVRWWLVSRIVDLAPVDALAGTPLLAFFLRAMGARIGARVHLDSAAFGAWDLIDVGDDASIGRDATLQAHVVERNTLFFEPIRVGARCVVGTRAHLAGGATMSDGARLDDLSLLARGAYVPPNETWSGSPARLVARSTNDAASTAPRARVTLAYAVAVLLLPLIEALAAVPALAIFARVVQRSLFVQLAVAPLAAVSFIVALCSEIVALKWIVLGRVRAGTYALDGWFAFRRWLFDRAYGVALDAVGALFATLYLPPWLRALGAKIGRGAEVSTASDFVPDLLEIGEGSFVADAVSLGAPRVGDGCVRLSTTRVGARAFVGNSAVVATGATLGDGALVGCITRASQETPKKTAWIGSPAIALPRRRASESFDEATTFHPTRARVALRWVIELARVVGPTTLVFAATCVGVHVVGFVARRSLVGAVASLPLVALLLGVVGAAIVVAAKWLLVGRYRAEAHPLWSSFVWRTELVTALHENVADPLLLGPLLGTPFAAWFFRALGAKIGARCYLATTCFTEYDLVTLGDDVALNEDCTLQTHLFEDRVMKTGALRIDDGCSVGAGSIVLYDTHLREGTSLGPLSLLMKGEALPASTRWLGAPAVHESLEK